MDGWAKVGRSIERDVNKAIAVAAMILVGIGGAIVYTFDLMRYRHRNR